MDEHLSTCAACAGRLRSLRRVARSLAPMQELVGAPRPEAAEEARGVVGRAASLANEILDAGAAARADLEALAMALPSPSAFPNLSSHHVRAAVAIARESLAADLDRSRALVQWSTAALEELRAREGGARWEGLLGAVQSTAAYLRLRAGDVSGALADLDSSRALLERSVPSRDLELAFWSYVRASCLHSLSRFDEALRDISIAEEIYWSFGDGRRRARSRFLHAILLSDRGEPGEALKIYDELLEDENLVADAPIHALLHLSLANDLVFTGATGRAKAVYARAASLLKRTGQENRLFRIRVGLADIAYQEGRTEEALLLNLQLRPVFRERRLPWDEVRRELWILRQLLELRRFEEARDLCTALVRRAEELSLRQEARRALAYLSQADRELTPEGVTRIQADLDRLSRGAATVWSVA